MKSRRQDDERRPVGTGWEVLPLALVGLLWVAPLSAQEDRRPFYIPEFQQGFNLIREAKRYRARPGDWEEAACKMHQALEQWPEDENNAKTSKRLDTRPYLPRYFLGVALTYMGCYRLALDQLETTLLQNHSEPLPGLKKELKALQTRCEGFVDDGVDQAPDADCASWRANCGESGEDGRGR